MAHLIDELDASCIWLIDNAKLTERIPDAAALLGSRSVHNIERGIAWYERYVLTESDALDTVCDRHADPHHKDCLGFRQDGCYITNTVRATNGEIIALAAVCDRGMVDPSDLSRVPPRQTSFSSIISHIKGLISDIYHSLDHEIEPGSNRETALSLSEQLAEAQRQLKRASDKLAEIYKLTTNVLINDRPPN